MRFSVNERVCISFNGFIIGFARRPAGVNTVFDSQTETAGLTAGICASISLFTSVSQLLKHKKAEDISLFYPSFYLSAWLRIWYGMLRDDIPILVTNGFSLVINGIIIVLGVKYKRSSEQMSH